MAITLRVWPGQETLKNTTANNVIKSSNEKNVKQRFCSLFDGVSKLASEVVRVSKTVR